MKKYSQNENEMQDTAVMMDQDFDDEGDLLIVKPSKSKRHLANLIAAAVSRTPVTDVLTGEILEQYNMTIYVGADVHSNKYSLCSYNPQTMEYFLDKDVAPDPANIEKYCQKIASHFKAFQIRFIVGYESGCLGFSIANHLINHGINCVVMATSSIRTSLDDRACKTDRRDAHSLAFVLAVGDYTPVYIPDALDEQVKNYIRMYEDMSTAQKKIKQQINAFALQHGYTYDLKKTKWTKAHLDWLGDLKFESLDKETLSEYLLQYRHNEDTLDRLRKRIEELADMERYKERCAKLTAFKGIKKHSALILLSEVGDFDRFDSTQAIDKYVGLIPTERSSGTKEGNRGCITKMGNSHVRTILTECVQGTVRGVPGKKSKDLKKRQEGLDPQVIAYADKGTLRIQRKYKAMIDAGKPRNVAITACARELLNFSWGMETDRIYGRSQTPPMAAARS